jgi:N-methylhydantoinase A
LSAWTIGLDLGGTFADCTLVGGDGRTVIAKAPSVRDDPIAGVLAALDLAAARAGLDLDALLAATSRFTHGTTIGLNALLTRTAGTVGLLTTRGHEDAILIGRVRQKVAGLRPDELIRTSELRKPAPLVPRHRIRGIVERIDAAGREVVALDERAVASAGIELAAMGCDALAVAFLWSFRTPTHERRAAEILHATMPSLPVVLSSEVAPVLGEYERTAATVVNAALLKPFQGYLDRLEAILREHGFPGELALMGVTGGALPLTLVAGQPAEALRSGPIGGIVAAQAVLEGLGEADAITADMGGTSFDVGLLVGGAPTLGEALIVDQLDLAMPVIELESIGAGGGSIAWLDGEGGLHVGPASAGSNPGPACYGRGGTEPTVTDADLLLGRIDAGAGGNAGLALDRDLAEAAIGRLAQRLGLDPVAAAHGIVRVADAQMADLLRSVTLERGHDPRRLALIAFGGAGPLHAGGFAPDAGVREVIVPPFASVLAAVGLATAQRRRAYRRSLRSAAPLDPVVLGRTFAELEGRACEEFRATSSGRADLRFERWIELRYRRQTHQLRVPLEGLDEQAAAGVVADFERLYERTFGTGTGYAAAGIEATGAGLLAVVEGDVRDRLAPRPEAPIDGREPDRRPVFFDRWIADTPVHAGRALHADKPIEGPAVIDWGTTALIVHPGQSARLDPAGNVHLRLRRDDA